VAPDTAIHLLVDLSGSMDRGVSVGTQRAPAPDAEALMRSRYCACVRGNADYLLATWHPATRAAQLTLDGEPPLRWLGLQVRQRATTGADTAVVEFVARYRIGNRAQRLHETSRFVRVGGRWYYLDGEFPDREGPS
jgi:SEC-C motif-containing protein